MPFVGRRKTRRTNRRLARIRLQDPGALPKVKADGRYTTREVRQVRRENKRVRSEQRQERRERSKNQYSPLDLLTGNRLKQEMKAAEQLEFGDRETELQRALSEQQQTTANTGSYYDDYREALRLATERVNAMHQANVAATEGRVDTAYQQDKSAVEQRDAAASAQAAKLGRAPVRSEEGARAVEAQRSQGNQAAAQLRGQATADTKYMELRGANAALGKAQAVERQQKREGELREDRARLEQERGAFRTDFRRRTRQDERQWAAIQKEFGLEKQKLKLDQKNSRADRRLERQKVNAQKIVARLYAAADRKAARAQIRVAKLQLEKGRIGQQQYKTIRNIYEGLPGGGGSGGGKSGGKQKLQTWERDKVTNAVRILEKNSAGARDKQTWIKRMQDEGMPLRLARIAWRRYAQRFVQAPGRPHDSQQP
jgi:hypothetical protein